MLRLCTSVLFARDDPVIRPECDDMLVPFTNPKSARGRIRRIHLEMESAALV